MTTLKTKPKQNKEHPKIPFSMLELHGGGKQTATLKTAAKELELLSPVRPLLF